MNWLLLVRVLRNNAATRRLLLSDDMRAATLEDIADAIETTLDVMQRQELKEIIGQ